MSEEQFTKLIDFYLDNAPPGLCVGLLEYTNDLRVLLEELLSFIEGNNLDKKEEVRFHMRNRKEMVANSTADAILDGEPFIPSENLLDRSPERIDKEEKDLTERQREYLKALNDNNWSRSATAIQLGVSQASVSFMVSRHWPSKLLKQGVQPR